MSVMVGPAETFGEKLAALRTRRGMSQLALSLEADISARHLSFLETGRASPSRDMVGRLASALAVTRVEEGALLVAAGFAAPIAGRISGLDPSSARADPGGALAAMDRVIAIQEAPSFDAASTIAANALADLGLTNFFTGVLTPPSRETPLTIAFGNTDKAPVAWLAHYDQRGFRDADPFVEAVTRVHRPFYWDDVLAGLPKLSRRQVQILNEARDFRINSGFVMPIRRADGTVHAASCMGEEVSMGNPATMLRARYVTTALLERAEQSQTPSEYLLRPPKLGPRASSCLQWVISGKDVSWISERLSLPMEDVGSVLARACAALGASDLPQAAMRARRYRLMEFD